MNGDVLTTLDYGKLVEHHRTNRAALTVATYRKQVKIDLGVIEADECGHVFDYREKPDLNYFVSMGIYIYEPRVLGLIPKGGYLDFPDLVKRLLTEGELVSTYLCDGYWLDIGRHEDYEMAADQFAAHRSEFNID
jgi:NDP-sugar pyrophosphorylase family protein